MWIQLLKDYLGHKAGEKIDVEDDVANLLIQKGTATRPAGDPMQEVITRHMDSLMGGVSKAINSALEEGLKEFAKAQSLSRKGQASRILGGSDTDPKKTFGAFLVAVRRQDQKALDEFGSRPVEWEGKDMTSQTGASGGFTVPTQFYSELQQSVWEMSIVRRYAGLVVPMSSKTVEIPMLDQSTAPSSGDTAMFGGLNMRWTEEGAAMTEDQPAFKQLKLEARELSGYTQLSNSLSADNGVGLDTVLRTLFAEAVAWFEDYAFLRGDGVGKPLGFLTWAGLISVTRSAASAFALSDAAGMMARLLPNPNEKGIAWVAHPTVFGKMLQMVASSVGGNLVWGRDVNNKPILQLWGIPVHKTEKLPALNTTGDVMICDFGRYAIGDRQQYEVAFSEHVAFTSNMGTWRVVSRVDGAPRMKSYVTLSDASSTLSPAVALAAG